MHSADLTYDGEGATLKAPYAASWNPLSSTVFWLLVSHSSTLLFAASERNCPTLGALDRL